VSSVLFVWQFSLSSAALKSRNKWPQKAQMTQIEVEELECFDRLFPFVPFVLFVWQFSLSSAALKSRNKWPQKAQMTQIEVEDSECFD
jgi:hypothetical protein